MLKKAGMPRSAKSIVHRLKTPAPLHSWALFLPNPLGIIFAKSAKRLQSAQKLDHVEKFGDVDADVLSNGDCSFTTELTHKPGGGECVSE
jgi:hypothetical protein